MKSQIYIYDKEAIEVDKVYSEAKLKELVNDESKVSWLNFHGLDDISMIQTSFDKFGIHRLTQQDILTLNERPKIEEFEGYLFVTLKSAYWKNKAIESEQISFVLSNSNLISYQEKEGDIFNEIRFRITNSSGIVRKRTVDYLLYLLIDAVITGYQKVLSKIQDRVDVLQMKIREDFDKTLFHQIDFEKEQLKFLKKTILPMRDQINKLITGNNVLIKEKNQPYFSDLKDQILYLVDEIDSERTDLESMSNMYFAALSQKSNEIMQFLTIVAAIFIPLTFVAGVYGMNFKYIPELQTEYGYFVFWGVMIAITSVLVLYFRKKNWF